MIWIEKLGEYTKENKWEAGILIVLYVVTVLVTLKYKYSFFDENSLYWIFSSVFQAFAALLAFTAAVVIFRIQNNKSDLNRVMDSIRSFMQIFKGEAFAISSTDYEIIDEATKVVDEVLESHTYYNKVKDLNVLINRVRDIEEDKNKTIDSLRYAASANMLVIIFSLTGLIFVRSILNLHLDIPAVIFTSYLSAMALVSIRNLLFLLYE